MSGDEFDWWFDGNPAGCAALRGASWTDRVVGVAAHSLYADGARRRASRLASFSVHATTDRRRHAGAGIFVELERKHEREAQERGRRVRARLRERADGAALPRPARLDARSASCAIWARPRLGERFRRQRPRVSTSTATRRRRGRTTSSATPSTSTGATSTRRAATRLVVGERRRTPSSGRRSEHRGRTISVVADLVEHARRWPARQAVARAAAGCRAAGARAAARVPRCGFVPTPRRSTSWARRSPAG